MSLNATERHAATDEHVRYVWYRWRCKSWH